MMNQTPTEVMLDEQVAILKEQNAALLEASKEALDILYNIPEDLSNWQTTNASIQEAHDIIEEAIRKASP